MSRDECSLKKKNLKPSKNKSKILTNIKRFFWFDSGSSSDESVPLSRIREPSKSFSNCNKENQIPHESIKSSKKGSNNNNTKQDSNNSHKSIINKTLSKSTQIDDLDLVQLESIEIIPETPIQVNVEKNLSKNDCNNVIAKSSSCDSNITDDLSDPIVDKSPSINDPIRNINLNTVSETIHKCNEKVKYNKLIIHIKLHDYFFICFLLVPSVY